jgi:hypothetical protein
MSRQSGSERSASLWAGRTGYEPFWNKVTQSIRDEDFVTVSLFSIVGLLVSLYLTFLINIPAV